MSKTLTGKIFKVIGRFFFSPFYFYVVFFYNKFYIYNWGRRKIICSFENMLSFFYPSCIFNWWPYYSSNHKQLLLKYVPTMKNKTTL